jgi:tRNA-modifying protein YgfZ
MSKFTYLSDRAVLHITGEDALGFLDGLVTCDMNKPMPRFGALLSPQGKILFDFIIHGAKTGFYIDCAKSIVADFVKRLGFYKLRAKIEIKDVSDELGVVVSWGEAGNDPRLGALGKRSIKLLSSLSPVMRGLDPRIHVLSKTIKEDVELQVKPAHDDASNYHSHRIALGVPEGGKDFAFGEAFPHEALMDQLNGVDFKKGCYVGQEVVSRMQHRGTARTRMMQVVLSEELNVELPLPILAGDKTMGELRSVSRLNGLALVRIDRVSEVIRAGMDLTAGGKIIHIKKPDFAEFEFPVVENKD